MLRKATFRRASFWSRVGTAAIPLAIPLVLSSSLGWIVSVDSIKRCLGLSLTQGCAVAFFCCCVDGGFSLQTIGADDRNPWLVPAAVLGGCMLVGLVLGGWLLGMEIKETRLADRYVTVKGLVERT